MKTRIIIVLILCVASGIAIATGLQNGRTQNAASAILGMSARTQLASCLLSIPYNGTPDSWTIERTDINTDGRPDAFVRIEDQCGNAGCIYEMCLSTPEGDYAYEHLGIAAKEIRTQPTAMDGMHDIEINGDGGLTMSWNGSSYELNDARKQ
jgi:hypothetical protein